MAYSTTIVMQILTLGYIKQGINYNRTNPTPAVVYFTQLQIEMNQQCSDH